jgi:hypothetical protein
MTKKMFDPPLNLLEQRFQALQERAASLPEGSRSELEADLRGLSQAIAALRAAGGSPQAEGPDFPVAQDSPVPADTILSNIFRAIPDLLTVHFP